MAAVSRSSDSSIVCNLTLIVIWCAVGSSATRSAVYRPKCNEMG